MLGWVGEILSVWFKCVFFDEMYGFEKFREIVYLMLKLVRDNFGKDWVFDEKYFGKIWVFDGWIGERFDCLVIVGIVYMLKLVYLVDDKIYVCFIGFYFLVI